MAKVCRWHLCHQQGRTQSGSTTTYQQPRPTHPVHSGTHTTRLTSILRHSSHNSTGQHLQHLSHRKPTHTDQYLHWDSNHHITAKQSVLNTLAHKAKVVSSSQDRLEQELQHIKTALQACQFPNWALNQWHHKFTNNNIPTINSNSNNNNQQDNNPNKRNITIVAPFIPGTSEKFRKLCKNKGIQVHY